MASRSDRLPRRFPIGTKFVIEGKAGSSTGYNRYLEFPDGTFFPLPARPSARKPTRSARMRRRLRGRTN